ncbi:LysR family transcriptional regulator [Bradyrhizobium sp. WSM 1738]|uniref:LysR family transcriptional regulator n=1 Tax=Bradyrhizobium hereditatis TaxID=2821405 RepID=UPI001CE39173|nr:LysR substrate-binding domain-containing protein [Bradyrhizobium hereditatis]MCA6119308.1 LysR family transcriptional regulator [Bradyrhizobium hereditatis]
MQYRHLYYFVRIVEAGSFSQAARTIHVAQPALSQQISELEASLGVPLLQRSARGIKPTAAGQRFYEEASSILRRYENLPGLVRSSAGEVQGLVSLGMPASLSTTLVGPFIEVTRAAHPKITLKFIDGNSALLREEIEKRGLDLALVFEDEFFPVVHRQPLFRQNHYLISGKRSPPIIGPSVSLEEVSKIPLVLPGHLSARRIAINRTFAEAGLSLNVAAEAVTVASELSAVRSGAASTIMNLGDMSGFSLDDFAEPVLIEPTFYLTCCLIWSNEFALTLAAEAVKKLLIEFLKEHIEKTKRPGALWLD